jgi:hypothetical protein
MRNASLPHVTSARKSARGRIVKFRQGKIRAPAIRTSPVASRVAVCPVRAAVMLLVGLKGAGAWIVYFRLKSSYPREWLRTGAVRRQKSTPLWVQGD